MCKCKLVATQWSRETLAASAWRAVAGLALLLTLLAGAANHASAAIWDGGGDYNWNTAANWNPDGVPSASDILVFAGSTGVVNTNNIAANTEFNGIIFSDDAAAFTLKGNRIFLSGAVSNQSANPQTILLPIMLTNTLGTIAGGTNIEFRCTTADMTVSNTIYDSLVSAGGVGILKTGTNTLYLTTTNTYRGSTIIAEGAVVIGRSLALGGATSLGTVVSNGAALHMVSSLATITEPLTITGTGITNSGALRSLFTTNTYKGLITLSGDALITVDTNLLILDVAAGNAIAGTGNLTLGCAGTMTILDAITHTGSLTKTNTGTLNLDGADTYTGDTLILQGTLKATTAGSAIPSGAGKGNVFIGPDGTLDVADTGGVDINGLTGSGIITNSAGNGYVSAGNNNASSTFDGVILHGGTYHAFEKVGSGTLTLTGANTYTGLTTITAGTIALSGSGTIGNGPALWMETGATLDISAGSSVTLGSGRTFTLNGTNSTIVTASGKDLIMSANGTLAISAYKGLSAPLVITGDGNLTLASGNRVTLSPPATTNILMTGTYPLTSGGRVNGTVPSTLISTFANGGTTLSLSIVAGDLILTVAKSDASLLAIGGDTAYTTNIAGTLYGVHVFTTAQSASFQPLQTFDAEYLVVGGGGGGSRASAGPAGGGGAGGFITGSTNLSAGAFAVTVGAGGGGRTGSGGAGSAGGDSSIARAPSVTAGGGGGGVFGALASGNNGRSANGNGGGGGGATTTSGGSGNGAGFAGGSSASTGDNNGGGGGGGAGEVGGNGTSSIGGKGGDGLSSALAVGTNRWYCGGGGGDDQGGGGGEGGKGGGAAGNTATAATANTGGGGGGNVGANGGNGGSGIVIIRYVAGAAAPLSVSVTSPTNNQSFAYDVSSITATAVVANAGAGLGVTFYTDTNGVSYTVAGTGSSPTSTVTLTGPFNSGTYHIYAVATDAVPSTATSETNTFTIIAQKTLTVVTAHGNAWPGTLTTNYGASVSQWLTNSPVIDGTAQYVCTAGTVVGNESTQVNPTNVTLTLTNNATLTWQWTADAYYLNTATNGVGGSVDVASGWQVAGSNVTITAMSNANWHFVSWSGDTTDCFIVDNVITAAMTQARSIVANFAGDPWTLTVATAYGNAWPGTLTTNYGSYVSQWLTNSPVADGATTQFVCTGAAVAGNDFMQVNATNATMTLTNNATLTWQWTTNYLLSTDTNGMGGSVDVASGWQGAGSNVTITAISNANWHFVSWSGDTTDCFIVDNVITAVMTQARSITANFEGDPGTLTVATAYGNAWPGTWTTNIGASVSQWLTNSPVADGATTQFVCTGAAVAGNDFTQVNATNATLTLTNNATLTWLWTTNYLLTTDTNGIGGSVDVASSWQGIGSNVTVTATSNANWHFVSWSGETTDCFIVDNVITAAMTQARSITANFEIDQKTLTVATVYGNAWPGTLTTNYGASVSQWLTNSPVIDGTVQYACTAGTVVGNEFTQVNPTNVTLTLTNNATLTWQWTADAYYLTTATNGLGGSVDVASGWQGAGSNVTITAISNANWHFVSWSGDTTDCFMVDNVITAAMTQARSITANFAIDQKTLTVATAYGNAWPGTLTTNYDASVSQWLTNSPVIDGATQYVCTAGTVVGNEFAQVNPTNVTLTLTNHATLTWQWTADAYYLTTDTNGVGGSVDVASGWQSAGSNVTITAISNANWHFVSWSGDTTDCFMVDNVITAVMTQARSIMANFEGDPGTLTVVTAYGNAWPGTWTTNFGASVSQWLTNSPVADGATTQFVCTGAAVAGNDFTQVNATNATLTLTNNATMTWLWTTNYLLSTDTNGIGGSVDVASGWQGAGSNVTITAISNANWHFVSWSGDTTDCFMVDNVITAAMTQARSIMAEFAIDQKTLTVATAYGNAWPGTWTTNYGASVSQWLTNSPVIDGTAQYACTAGTVVGNEFTQVNPTNVTLTLTNNATLTWQWTVDAYYLTTATNGLGGSVDVASGWQSAGSNVTITAISNANWHFVSWSGDTTDCFMVDNVITAAMTQARSITANFAIDQKTLTVATAYGNAWPGTLTTNYGASVSQWLTNSPVIDGTAQYVCTAGTVVGNEFTQVNPTNVTLTLTNHATLTWQWTADAYYLTTATNGVGGSVDVASGWQSAGSNVTITATSNANWHFVSWSGDTTDCFIVDNVITAAMTQARSIMANFAIDQKTLTVATAYGNAWPGTVTTNYSSSVSQWLTNSPVIDGATQYVCTAGTVVGNEFTQVNPTNVTLSLTNHATLTWQWAADAYYLITATNGVGGSVDVASGWQGAGSNVTITATSNANWHFVSWSGDTTDCFIVDNVITAVMTQARSITANFEGDPVTLTVATAYGNAWPGTWTTNFGASVSQWLTNSPVADGATTQYVCTGAAVAGNDFTQVNATNATLTLTNNATMTWQWTTNYLLTTDTNGVGGSVDVASGWQGAGSNVTIAAMANVSWRFVSWSGDTTDCFIVDNVITVAMTQARSIMANFELDQQTLTVTTAYGNAWPGTLTTNFGASVSQWLTNSPVIDGATQYVCTAGTVIGNAFTQVNPTNVTLALTNNATLTWQWAADAYYLTTDTNGIGGSVDVASGWQGAGSNVTITAMSNANWHFVSWSGDTTDCIIVDNVITAAMTQARSIMANFAIDQKTLSVATAYGNAWPGTLTTNYGASVSQWLTNSPVIDGATQYVCTAGTVVGNASTQVNPTNVTLTLTNNATLTWQWAADAYYLITATNGVGGSVDVVSGWQGAGSNVTITAISNANWHFVSWSGATTGCIIVDNVITVAMTQARNIMANFAIDQKTLTVATAYGNAWPGTVTTNYGSSVSQWLTNSPVIDGATQYVCTAGTVIGNAFTQVNPTNVTLTLTNHATLTWQWAADAYYLTTATNGIGGSVDVVSGWQGAGSNVAITAMSNANWHFVSWSGDTTDCFMVDNVITAAMTQARSITANFAIDQKTLIVATAYGNAWPGTLTTNYGASVSQWLTNSPVIDGATQYVCTAGTVIGNASTQVNPTNVTLTLTNHATLTWQWAADAYYLTTDTNGLGGSVDVVSGWQGAGSNVAITAMSNANWHFVSWSGDTTDCFMVDNVITVAMTQARNITANFAIDQKTLTVATAYGNAWPGTLTTNYGALVSQWLTNSPVIDGATQYVCTAGTVVGNAFTQVNPTNVTLTMTNHATLTWQWAADAYYLITATNGIGGSVDVASGWQGAGSNVTITAMANVNWHFVSWSGDTTDCIMVDNVITAAMTQARSITANFAIDQKTLTVATAYGNAWPGTLTTNYGASVSQWLTNSPVIDGVTTQFVCTGAAVAGNDFTQVNATNATLTLTNNATMTWLWETNYAFASIAGVGGSTVGSADGWYMAGSMVTVTGVANLGYHFVAWSGDTNGCTLSSNVLSGAMDQGRTITANFALNPVMLTIVSEYGTATRAVGIYTNLYGAVLTNMVTGEEIMGGTQYVSRGWVMTGNAQASGATTNCVMTHTNNAVLTWLWATNYYLSATATSGGSIIAGSDTNGWYAKDDMVVLLAANLPHYYFTGWFGNTENCFMGNMLLVGFMTQARTIYVDFAAYMATNGTPHWWLAQYGLSTDDAGALWDDGDGMPAWQEYIAGTDPTSAASVLKISSVASITTNGFVLSWPSVTGRVYGVDRATNLLVGGFSSLTSGLPATPVVNVWTDNVSAVSLQGFYRIVVTNAP